MYTYAVYVKSNEHYNNIVPIKEGFSLVAAILSVFWALYNKMWHVVIALVLINMILASVQFKFIATTNFVMACHITIMLAFGIFATELKEFELHKKGYELKDIVFAKSQDEAEIEFVRKY